MSERFVALSSKTRTLAFAKLAGTSTMAGLVCGYFCPTASPKLYPIILVNAGLTYSITAEVLAIKTPSLIRVIAVAKRTVLLLKHKPLLGSFVAESLGFLKRSSSFGSCGVVWRLEVSG